MTPISLYIGDDWTLPFALQDANGSPVDLTGSTVGAVFYASGIANPVDLALGSGITMPSPTSGTFTVTVDKSVTSTVKASLPTRLPPTYPVRLQVLVTDTYAHRRTYAVVPIIPLDPRTVV